MKTVLMKTNEGRRAISLSFSVGTEPNPSFSGIVKSG